MRRRLWGVAAAIAAAGFALYLAKTLSMGGTALCPAALPTKLLTTVQPGSPSTPYGGRPRGTFTYRLISVEPLGPVIVRYGDVGKPLMAAPLQIGQSVTFTGDYIEIAVADSPTAPRRHDVWFCTDDSATEGKQSP